MTMLCRYQVNGVFETKEFPDIVRAQARFDSAEVRTEEAPRTDAEDRKAIDAYHARQARNRATERERWQKRHAEPLPNDQRRPLTDSEKARPVGLQPLPNSLWRHR